MHMLFLGHVKSDIDMVSKWLGRYEISATFGKQANMYLQAVRNLRANRYFAAHPFSTSSWGTGVWVSENYLFWGRVMKFFLILPALNQQRLIMNNEKYIKRNSDDQEICFHNTSLFMSYNVDRKSCF